MGMNLYLFEEFHGADLKLFREGQDAIRFIQKHSSSEEPTYHFYVVELANNSMIGKIYDAMLDDEQSVRIKEWVCTYTDFDKVMRAEWSIRILYIDQKEFWEDDEDVPFDECNIKVTKVDYVGYV